MCTDVHRSAPSKRPQRSLRKLRQRGLSFFKFIFRFQVTCSMSLGHTPCVAPHFPWVPAQGAADERVSVSGKSPPFHPPSRPQVPEIIQYICHRTRGVTETTAQATIRDLLCLLARTYTDEVVLVLFKIQDQSRSSRVRRLWEMLASVPRDYEEIMESLQQRMTQRPEPGAPEPRDRRQISPLMATRAIHELLLEPRQRIEVQSLFASLFMALLLRTSFLVAVGGAEPSWDQQHGAESMDPMSSTVDALKALMRSAGYGDLVSYVQKLGGWELLASRERHHEGVALLARAMVIKSCWHNRPVFSLVIGALQAHDGTDHLTALTFATELPESKVPKGNWQKERPTWRAGCEAASEASASSPAPPSPHVLVFASVEEPRSRRRAGDVRLPAGRFSLPRSPLPAAPVPRRGSHSGQRHHPHPGRLVPERGPRRGEADAAGGGDLCQAREHGQTAAPPPALRAELLLLSRQRHRPGDLPDAAGRRAVPHLAALILVPGPAQLHAQALLRGGGLLCGPPALPPGVCGVTEPGGLSPEALLPWL
ncbi:uncharacterized protein LOC107195501 isoform X4 [Pteropus alecto]|uniref:uncharacterized protein LOC107195501 isoform X4 n=1 Tax=Pteropus alecto TaxID=9402 RepID=UPI000D5381D8|nr:uncharacterized protein LOC107195501 isoform X4 [Pteropus alecto]